MDSQINTFNALLNEVPVYEGASGRIYQREHLGKSVAIKVLKKNPLQASNGFKEEIEMLQKLEHPNILQLIEYSSDFNSFITPFYKNGHLFNFISQFQLVKDQTETKRSINRTLMFQLATAIQYLHSSKIAHRDIKCPNIFIDDLYSIVLGDFGFALHHTEGLYNRKNMIIGTKLYLAPENFKGQQIDLFQNDIFALGQVFFQIYFGCPPFYNSEDCLYYKAFVKNPGRFFSQIEDNADFVELIINMLCADPVSRYDIDQVLNSEFFQGQAIFSPETIGPLITDLLSENTQD